MKFKVGNIVRLKSLPPDCKGTMGPKVGATGTVVGIWPGSTDYMVDFKNLKAGHNLKGKISGHSGWNVGEKYLVRVGKHTCCYTLHFDLHVYADEP